MLKCLLFNIRRCLDHINWFLLKMFQDKAQFLVGIVEERPRTSRKNLPTSSEKPSRLQSPRPPTAQSSFLNRCSNEFSQDLSKPFFLKGGGGGGGGGGGPMGIFL